MGDIQVSIFETIVAGLTLAALLGMWAMLRRFVKEQRDVNEANKQFIRSMQRAEIVRYFRIVVEQGNPVTTEELEHLNACYKAYHDNGGNGTGTLMYERIRDHVHLVTEPKEATT